MRTNLAFRSHTILCFSRKRHRARQSCRFQLFLYPKNIRLLKPPVLGINSSFIDQNTDSLWMTSLLGKEQGSLSFIIIKIDICTIVQQCMDNITLVFSSCIKESSLTHLISLIHVRTKSNHLLDTLDLSISTCIEQWTLTKGVTLVKVCSLGVEKIQKINVSISTNIEEWGLTVNISEQYLGLVISFEFKGGSLLRIVAKYWWLSSPLSCFWFELPDRSGSVSSLGQSG